MPGGTGVAGPRASQAARRAAASVQVPANASATALTLKAIDVVQAVARAQGRPLPHVTAPAAAAPGAAGDTGGSGATPWILIGCAIVLVVGGALILVGLRWQRTA